MADVFGLGIESSCDETAVALVKNGREILAAPIFSQIEIHKPFGGVIPENASRAHLDKIPWLLKEALAQFEHPLAKLSYVAATVKPGLTGSLLVGYNTALAVSLLSQAPIIPVHHLEAHLYAAILEGKKIEPPFLGLLLSGGNSAIFRVDGLSKVTVLADTMDDACGEAFDKAASLLQFPYPGGPEIEKAALRFMAENNITLTAEESWSQKNPLPVILKDQPRVEPRFSFSGIKTALLYLLEKQSNPYYSRDALAYFFLQRATESVRRNLGIALESSGLKQVVFAGGVAANSYLRAHVEKVCRRHQAELIVPHRSLCTDNAAMVAAVGYLYYQAGYIPQVYAVASDNAFNFQPS